VTSPINNAINFIYHRLCAHDIYGAVVLSEHDIYSAVVLSDYDNRKLKSKGHYHGAAAVLVHLQRRSARHFILTTANVGDTEVVLCRRGEAVLLTRKFVTSADRTECQRVCKLDGFITVASVVWLICSAVDRNTKMLISFCHSYSKELHFDIASILYA